MVTWIEVGFSFTVFSRDVVFLKLGLLGLDLLLTEIMLVLSPV